MTQLKSCQSVFRNFFVNYLPFASVFHPHWINRSFRGRLLWRHLTNADPNRGGPWCLLVSVPGLWRSWCTRWCFFSAHPPRAGCCRPQWPILQRILAYSYQCRAAGLLRFSCCSWMQMGIHHSGPPIVLVQWWPNRTYVPWRSGRSASSRSVADP